jgi:hypothetical protein
MLGFAILSCISFSFDYHWCDELQFLRFIRRTEGVEAARKFFSEARKSPNCTYQVYVAYAMMAFCLDKDPKVNFCLVIAFFLLGK